ncbi:cation:proton antiporter [Mycolicibacterium flavescens]|uniref:Sodium:proton exchanger n=1 Tax=Mycolicibacterium flavescens TaxID=1776 RepID=A0A1E3RKX8_MYCFV|nr:cation:proton antiporter [Mycolicibacterium flavescens]MCV7280568.1 cation:proton antiporter [Mycolicibacterium flavescens]ODQ90047.1 sodium:proton exchanger [Mycolicibacterium flavescens]
MLLSLIAISAVLAAWALGAKHLERWRLTAPMVLVLAGIAVGFTTRDGLADSLNTEVAQHIAEIILAILLFVDATDIRGGLFGREPRAAMRVLFIAMPLSLAAAVALGLWLLPGVPWAVLLVLACIVVPTDFAPAPSILRDHRVPERVRDVLNVEAGYNDGIISPLFIFALALAGDRSHASSPMEALASALPQAAKAILIGLAVGAALAVLTNTAERRGAMTDRSKRLILVAAPMLAFGLSTVVDGNGFVAAFVCGIAFHYLRRSPSIHAELALVDDIGYLLTVVMWFVIGATAVLAATLGVTWSIVLYCLLALTVVRLVPTLLALAGSPFSWPERVLVGWLGPRGTTSIVFGLLAFNVLGCAAEAEVLMTMVLVVLGSVVVHGATAPAAAHAFSRSQPRLSS